MIGVPAGILAAGAPASPAGCSPRQRRSNNSQPRPARIPAALALHWRARLAHGARHASVYALLPIVRGTVTGVQQVDRAVIEAGVAMGMTGRQLLWLVELPLALPAIVAGIRVATVIGVATATIAAAIGAGGLGEYIFRGLSMADSTTILAGAIPAAVLALVADAGLGWIGRRLAVSRITTSSARGGNRRGACDARGRGRRRLRAQRRDAVVVGSKNFTEQVILGELMAQRLEAEGVRVDAG